MADFLLKTKNNYKIREKSRVYFTSHQADFEKYFEKICEDIFLSQDCAIYYTSDMQAAFDEKSLKTDLGRMNLFVVPITSKLLNEDCRAMTVDIPFAFKNGIPVLPIMMEDGLVDIYSQKDKFGQRQYLSPISDDSTAISYEKKLEDYLNSVLISSETAAKIRAAFDAYVFLSYRKKDRHYANELMRLIHSNPKYRDIAIWYDEFLTPGESFRDGISKALSSSKLFALLVTPNLLEDPNFVKDEEYPMAKPTGIGIMPVEMVKTDNDKLKRYYNDIPDCISPYNTELFNERLADLLYGIALSENDNDPEHNYLIGLAYLEGIDVEVDRERAIALLNSAADGGYLDAIEKLRRLYNDLGDYKSSLKYAELSYLSCKEKFL